MATIILKPAALEDLDEIWLFIASSNLVAADGLIDTLTEKFDMLAANANIGQSCQELAPGLRRFPVGNYLIFYRVIDNGIEIVRILHGMRDIPTLFGSIQ